MFRLLQALIYLAGGALLASGLFLLGHDNVALGFKTFGAGSLLIFVGARLRSLPIFSSDASQLAMTGVLSGLGAVFFFVLTLYPVTYDEYLRAQRPALDCEVIGFDQKTVYKIEYRNPLCKVERADGGAFAVIDNTYSKWRGLSPDQWKSRMNGAPPALRLGEHETIFYDPIFKYYKRYTRPWTSSFWAQMGIVLFFGTLLFASAVTAFTRRNKLNRERNG